MPSASIATATASVPANPAGAASGARPRPRPVLRRLRDWLRAGGDAPVRAPLLDAPLDTHPWPGFVGPDEPAVHALARALQKIRALVGYADNAQGSLEGAFSQIDDRARIVLDRVVALREQSDAARSATQHSIQAHQASLDVLSQRTHEDLGGLSQDLDERLRLVGDVLDGLKRTSKQLEMLAVNASIQAARAGESGRAFGILATAMRELAESSTQEAARIRTMLDFSAFQNRFDGFTQTLGDGLQACGRSLEHAFGEVGRTQQSLIGQIDAIEAATRVVPDMLVNARVAIDRGQRLLATAQEDCKVLADAAEQDDPTTLPRTALAIGSPSGGPHTVLEDVYRRGVLRVAVEPRFWGLSCRTPGQAELAGLDVEWARAFAAHLGVRLELVERPWVDCPALLLAGDRVTAGQPSMPQADLMWSALLPASSYHGLAFSRPYHGLHFVLVRRRDDPSITGLRSLHGRTLGCINDPAVFDVLRQEGVAWGRQPAARSTVRLANLVAYGELTDIFDALAAGRIDACPVDQPLAGWACGSPDSPWAGRFEILAAPITREPWHYAAGARGDPAALSLLEAVDSFIGAWRGSADHQAALRRWSAVDVLGSRTYQDEPGGLIGAAELRAAWSRPVGLPDGHRRP